MGINQNRLDEILDRSFIEGNADGRMFADVLDALARSVDSVEPDVSQAIRWSIEEYAGHGPPFAAFNYQYQNPELSVPDDFYNSALKALKRVYNSLTEKESEFLISDNMDLPQPTPGASKGEKKAHKKAKKKHKKARKREEKKEKKAKKKAKKEIHPPKDLSGEELDDFARTRVGIPIYPLRQGEAATFMIYAVAKNIKDATDGAEDQHVMGLLLEERGYCTQSEFVKTYRDGRKHFKPKEFVKYLRGRRHFRPVSTKMLEGIVNLALSRKGHGPISTDNFEILRWRKKLPVEYDPGATYELGDMIWKSNMFGIVYDKVHKDRIWIAFQDGSRKLHVENQPICDNPRVGLDDSMYPNTSIND